MSVLSRAKLAACRTDGAVVPDLRLRTRALILVRGRDVSGLNDFRIGHPQPPRHERHEQSGRTQRT